MLAVTGIRSRIVEELRKLLPADEEVVSMYDRVWPPAAERYLLCAGLLRPKSLIEQEADEVAESVRVNCIEPMLLCDEVLRYIPNARICVIGSESGFTWSHDGAYAAAKAALHKYVETKKLKPDQQLICVAPSIIGDSRMTEARKDTDNLEQRRLANPKQRFLKSVEIARLVHFLLYVDEGYTTGTVIRVNGGV